MNDVELVSSEQSGCNIVGKLDMSIHIEIAVWQTGG